MHRRFPLAAVALLWAALAHADSTKVVIGDIDDMSGPYADTNGPGAVEAIRMAIADFGGSTLGQPIELLTADHQNKPDIGAQKLRQWADHDGLTMVTLGANTGVSLAMASIAKEKRIPFFAIGSSDADKMMDELHKTRIDDMFTDKGVIRADGLMQHDIYVMQVKKPSESKYAWDYYRVVKKIPGEHAFGALADSTCPLVKK